jgi:hypothetical protein
LQTFTQYWPDRHTVSDTVFQLLHPAVLLIICGQSHQECETLQSQSDALSGAVSTGTQSSTRPPSPTETSRQRPSSFCQPTSEDWGGE